MYQPTGNTYFSGGGLMDIGLLQAGVKIQQSVDLDNNAVRAMEANPQYFSHRIICRDIKDMLVLDQMPADVFFFTWPCKKYSTIGDIHGVRTGDELYLHALRHVAIAQPEMYVCENVPGMKKFHVVMEAMTKLPGYYINIFCPLDAANWLPQKRQRLILIATKKPFTIFAPTPALKIPTIKDILEPGAQVEVNKTVVARIKGRYRDLPIIVDPEDSKSMAPTCVAHYAKDMGTRLVKDPAYKHGLRPFTIREYARLQGVPDDYVFSDHRYNYVIIGNGVPVDMARWIGEVCVKYFNKAA